MAQQVPVFDQVPVFSNGEAMAIWLIAQGYRVRCVADFGTPVWHVLTTCGFLFWNDGNVTWEG